jgi:hypothetical protein
MLLSAPRAPFGAVRAQGSEPTPTPIEEPTPVIEPVPMPEPIYLPLTAKNFDRSQPGAIDTALEGFLTGLSRAGRDACRPGTHALLDKPEGSRGAKVMAVLHDAESQIVLDLFMGEYVRMTGVSDLAPTGCRMLTDWVFDVDRIEAIDIPPR